MKPGDVVGYVSPYRTGVFDARIMSINHDGTYDLAVLNFCANPSLSFTHGIVDQSS
jgi:hypothetical protein